MDRSPETLKSALLLQPAYCATCSEAAAPRSKLTSLQAAVERNSLALICAAGTRARVTLQWAGGVSPSISAPAGS